jgi:hypothetical protein
MDVTLVYFDGCPNWKIVNHRLRRLTEEVELTITHRVLTSPEGVPGTPFGGSRTILVDGRDPFPRTGIDAGPACRIYPTPGGPAGAPTLEQLREVLHRR